MRLAARVQFLPVQWPTTRLKILNLVDRCFKSRLSYSIYVKPSPTIIRTARSQCLKESRFRVSAIVIVCRQILAVLDVHATYVIVVSK